MFACCHFYFRLQLPLIIIHITCISPSLCRTSAPIYLTSALGVLGTQETSCILIAGLLERDIFDLYLHEFDKPWVIHLRETCCCSTNLCTWRPNTVYKNRSVRRHHMASRGGPHRANSYVPFHRRSPKFYRFRWTLVTSALFNHPISIMVSLWTFGACSSILKSPLANFEFGRRAPPLSGLLELAPVTKRWRCSHTRVRITPLLRSSPLPYRWVL
jgi:hypothetical protein